MLAPAIPQSVPVDPIALRRAFGTFLTGVTIITTHDAEGRPRGMTANSFSSVSLDPPLLLVCVGKGASSFEAFNRADSFAVNLLDAGQTELSNLFASKSADKFATVSHDRIHTGAPVLSACMTWFDCTVHNRIDAGDHIILLGEVQAFGTSPSAPLGFCRGRYAAVKDPLPPDWLASSGMINGYLIEAEGNLLLSADGRGGWTLPSTPRRIVDGKLELAGAGSVALVPDDTFLYSVFDVSDGDPGYLIYRARLAQDAGGLALPEGFRFYPLEDLPFDDIPVREIRTVLKRYVRESANRRFGIFVASSDGGRLAMVDEAQPWAQVPQL